MDLAFISIKPLFKYDNWYILKMIDDLSGPALEHWLQTHPVRSVTELDDNVERVRARAGHDLRTLKDSRRQLNGKRFDRIVQRLDTRYRLIYSQLQDGQTTIVFSTEDLKVMIEQSLREPDPLSMDKFIQEEQNDDHGRRIETSSEDRERFFKVQESMNTYTASANDHDAACLRLNMDSSKPLMLEQYFGQLRPETELKLHQVVALDWILQIEELLGGTLLSDDIKAIAACVLSDTY